MTVMLLHGNPETSSIWEPLVAAWGRSDIVAPSLPGFGCDIPPGFGCTMEEYLAWLIDEVEGQGEPVHLIGHDWGGILTARLAITRPDCVASWASDALGALHPKYVWHDAAQVWQTPGAGEELVAAMTDPPEEQRRDLLMAIGVPLAAATLLAAVADHRMGRAMLSLYRSAKQPAMIEWGGEPQRARATRGLFLHATEDPYVGAALGTKELAHTMGAEVAELLGLGHWWMLDDPQAAAEVLEKWVTAATTPGQG